MIMITIVPHYPYCVSIAGHTNKGRGEIIRSDVFLIQPPG